MYQNNPPAIKRHGSNDPSNNQTLRAWRRARQSVVMVQPHIGSRILLCHVDCRAAPHFDCRATVVLFQQDLAKCSYRPRDICSSGANSTTQLQQKTPLSSVSVIGCLQILPPQLTALWSVLMET